MEERLKRYSITRWLRVLVGAWVMMVISIYQYSWSLFAFSLNKELGWDMASVGLTFTIFTAMIALIQPFTGIVADVKGPRRIAIVGSILVGAGMILCSYASSPWQLHLSYGIGGVGVGALYGISVATAVKWFPDRRGFATGTVVFGFGAGTALFNWAIQRSLETQGCRAAFFAVGIFMFIVLIPVSLFYQYPPDQWKPASCGRDIKTAKRQLEFRPQEMLKTYQWYLMYFGFTFTISIVLLFAAQLKQVAEEYHLPQNYFSLLMVIFPLANGLSRIASGAVSDRLGRERTMMVFYGALALSIIALLQWGAHPLAFLMLVFVAALLGGSPLALYPAIIGDYYGTKYSTVNYGITYTAKAWSGIVSGLLSGYFAVHFGSLKLPLLLIAAGSFISALISNPRMLTPPGSAGVDPPHHRAHP